MPFFKDAFAHGNLYVKFLVNIIAKLINKKLIHIHNTNKIFDF